jgi:hypothetical protein
MAIDIVVQRAAGLDIAKASLVACIRLPDGDGGWQIAKRKFTTMTADLLALADWLGEHGITRVGMESTADYWRPVFYTLEHRFDCWLLNARHMRAVPGRKTDLLTELPRQVWGGCVPGGVGLARFAGRDGRWRSAEGFGRVGGAGSGWFGGDRRSVPAVSAG